FGMESQQQQRGRSQSGGHRGHNLNSSQSPQNNHLDTSSNGLGLDPSGFSGASFSQSLNSPNLESPLFGVSQPYLAPSSQSFQYNTGGVPDQPFIQTQDFGQQLKQEGLSSNQQSPLGQFGHQQNAYQLQNYLGPASPSGAPNFPLYQNEAGGQEQSFDADLLLEESLQGFPQQPSGSINPADIMSSMSSPHEQHSPTPPNLLQPDQRQHSSGHQSPSLNQQPFRPAHQSHNNSLDPSSAAFPQPGQVADWTAFQGHSFEGHRRTPSEHSEVSSVAPSPYLNNIDSFDPLEQQHSPLLAPQPDSAAYQDALGIERFSISDPQNQQRGISPRHSPHISPRLSPLQASGPNQGGPPFMLSSDRQFGGGPGQEMYNTQGQEPFPGMQHTGSVDMVQAGRVAPPEINIEFAAPSRQTNFEPHKPTGNDNALSPPERGRKGRIRAKSDSFAGTSRSRPLSAGGVSPHLSPTRAGDRSLSPLGSASPKVSRRSSTSSVPNRDYILDLADPQRPGSSAADSKRVQKHPATFQCSLCPKRFTRAYNLRSHLRTHTDERPFVCTVCGKAFARQHDRKRHEGLHSGEKKFVCKGELKGGNNWGCGRRFARADALGRHFRSEAGRICIKPLLDEEAVERHRAFQEQQMMAQQGPGMHPQNMASMDVSGIDPSNSYPLPAALLAQYPALAQIQWDSIGTAGPDEAEGEISGRSSFDAGSGGEYYDDEGDGGGYVSGPGTAYSTGPIGGNWGGHEWASDYEGK
ncbi:hypothetical protein FGG08_007515, partial [Glutinoglossum americanum]